MRARNNDGINIQEQFGRVDEKESSSPQRSTRPEMKGPTDINDLISGLKTMSVNIPAPSANPNEKSVPTGNMNVKKSGPAQGQASTGKTPRKQKSDRNIVSLDI